MTLATIIEALTAFFGLLRRFDQGDARAAQTLRDIAKVLTERGLHIPAALAKVLTLSEGLTCAGPVM